MGYNTERLTGRDASIGKGLAEVDPVHELHQEERHASGVPKLIQRDDAGMVELSQGLGFTGESLGERRVCASSLIAFIDIPPAGFRPG